MASCGNAIDIIYTDTLALIVVVGKIIYYILWNVLGKTIDYILNMYQQHKTAAKRHTVTLSCVERRKLF